MFRIGIHHTAAIAQPAAVFADAVRARFPEAFIEVLDFTAETKAYAPPEAVTVIAYDQSPPDSAMASWLAKLPAGGNAPPLLIPLSCGPVQALPPAALQHLKRAHWPDDARALLDYIGVWLSLMLLPGAQKMFVSYTTSDGERAAVALEAHFQACGYPVFRDASHDRDDGSPNIEPGRDLHDVLAEHMRAASAVVLLDTPDAPKSDWIHGETKIAIGRRIPILPVVFRAPGDSAEGSRFRRLKELHRFVPMPLAVGTAPTLDGAALDRIAGDLGGFLLAIAQRRRAYLEGLIREFTKRGWTLEGYRDFHHLFEAQRRQLRTGQRGTWFFSCCSLEDDVRTASVIRFVQEVKDAKALRSYARHIYFHLGDPLFGEDLDVLQREAIPAVEDRKIDFCHFQEAPLMLGQWLTAH